MSLFKPNELLLFPKDWTIEQIVALGEESSGIFLLGRTVDNEVHKALLEQEFPVINIHEPISMLTSDRVRKSLEYIMATRAKRPPLIYVSLATPGGSLDASLETCDRLIRYPGGVVGTITGHAYSGGGIILQGCHKRTANEYAKIMLHTAWTLAAVNIHTLDADKRHFRRLRDDLRVGHEKMIHLVARRVSLMNGKTPEENIAPIRKLFFKEKFMYPEEALRYGLIDQVNYVQLTGNDAETRRKPVRPAPSAKE